jgi:hypothetical protein
MLHAAAAALDLIETGRIKAAGTLGALLHAEPHPAAYDGDPPHHREDPDPTTTVWQTAMASLRDVINISRHDAGEARGLLTLLTSPTRDQADRDRIRDEVIETGIPAEFLPTQTQTTSIG